MYWGRSFCLEPQSPGSVSDWWNMSTVCSSSTSLRLAQRTERCAQLRREQLRVLPHCEVAAPVSLVEIDQVAEGATGPRLLGANDLVWEHRDGHRDRDLVGLLRGRTSQVSPTVLPVDPRRRGGGVRQPVQ